jgi:DNA-binding HxlR family transcriptional regulator
MTRPAIAASDSLAINGVLVSARQAIDMICDRWTWSIVLALLLGGRRFTDLTERTGMASRLLTTRLKALEANGVIVRLPYSMHPPRFEYRLTNMGDDLLPIVLQMDRWEQAWSRPLDYTGRVTHQLCGAILQGEVRCRACGRPAGARDIVLKLSRAQLQKAPEKKTQHRRSIVSSEDDGKAAQLLGLSLDIFGDKWGIEILLCSFFGIRRFNDFRQSIGISANILSDRLDRLVAADLLSRGRDVHSQSGYWLTPKGVDAYAIMVSVHEWADKWVRGRYKSPVQLIHAACGKPFLPNLVCTNCEQTVRPIEVAIASRT